MAFTYQQMPHYFKKDLISYDECTSAVVTNNLFIDIFPPRLRINTLNSEYQNWKEGPDYQHIPPAYLYVPIPFYYLDGHPTIEVRRLSYVFIAYLNGLIFIIGIALLFKEKRATFAASLVAWLWLLTPFVRSLLNGNSFGYSDVVLACSVTLSFLLTLGLHKRIKSELPVNRSFYFFILLVATVPFLVKNVLGALPIAFFLLISIEGIKLKKLKPFEVALSIALAIFVCAFYYGLCWWKSPEAFKAEFFISFMHFENYEGWKKPWHYFVTNYLPNRYFGFMWWPFVVAFFCSLFLWFKQKNSFRKTILSYFVSYFLITLLVISIVTSKSANFALQGYIFILFFVLYNLINKVIDSFKGLKFSSFIGRLYQLKESVSIVIFAIMSVLVIANIYQMNELRKTPYKYVSQNEKFFQFGELARDVMYANARTLFVLDTGNKTYPDSLTHEDPDFWFRYYILFNSASEARRIEELRSFSSDGVNVEQNIKERYSKIYLVTSKELAEVKYNDLTNKPLSYGGYEAILINKSSLDEILSY